MSTLSVATVKSLSSASPVFQNSSGTEKGQLCKAWVNFNGTSVSGTNCAIRASGNVSSVVRNGTGDYTVNFTTAMPDANYAIVGSNVGSSSDYYYSYVTSYGTALSASSCRFILRHHDGTTNNMNYVHIAVFR